MSDDYDALEAAERREMAMDEMSDELARLRRIESAASDALAAMVRVAAPDSAFTDAVDKLDAALQPLRAGERSSPAKPACECCNGTGIGPVNSNFAGRPCAVCGGRG